MENWKSSKGKYIYIDIQRSVNGSMSARRKGKVYNIIVTKIQGSLEQFIIKQ